MESYSTFTQLLRPFLTKEFRQIKNPDKLRIVHLNDGSLIHTWFLRSQPIPANGEERPLWLLYNEKNTLRTCFDSTKASCKKSWGFCSLIVSFFTGVLFTFNWEYIVSLSYHQLFAGYWAQWQCCQVLWSIYGHIRQKPRPFSKLSRPALGLPFKKLKN